MMICVQFIYSIVFYKDAFKAMRSDPSPPLARLHKFFISNCKIAVTDAAAYSAQLSKKCRVTSLKWRSPFTEYSSLILNLTMPFFVIFPRAVSMKT